MSSSPSNDFDVAHQPGADPRTRCRLASVQLCTCSAVPAAALPRVCDCAYAYVHNLHAMPDQSIFKYIRAVEQKAWPHTHTQLPKPILRLWQPETEQSGWLANRALSWPAPLSRARPSHWERNLAQLIAALAPAGLACTPIAPANTTSV